MNLSCSIRPLGLAAVALATLGAPAAAQLNSRTETIGFASTMRQTTLASASHDAWERGRLVSDIGYLGSSGRSYELLVNAAGGSFPFAAYSVQVSPSVSVSGFVLAAGRRVVPTTSANLFPADVKRSFLLTTGSFTLAGNVLGTASQDLTFTPPSWSQPRWLIGGSMSGSAQGTLRLVGFGMLDYAANFGEQRLEGDFSMAIGGNGQLTYRRSAVDLRIRVAPLSLGTPVYRTLLSAQANAVTVSPFLWLSL
jgi:hypothetical protein